VKIDRKKFEQMVAEGIEAIPARFLEKLANVAVVVEDDPTPEQERKIKMRRGSMLLGLYEGVPQARRGEGYSGVLPDKITIFKNSIERVARDEADIRKIVKNTVWHEIAHHFGMDEKQVRDAEARRTKEVKKELRN
jgi:predicted Zn-dependent protease with MMP-like domain